MAMSLGRLGSPSQPNLTPELTETGRHLSLEHYCSDCSGQRRYYLRSQCALSN
jgi:hypothetical protein